MNLFDILITIILYTILFALIATTIRVFISHIRGEKFNSPFFESLASVLFFLAVFNFFFRDSDT
jgi:hypothetical protein